ncbi:hypothetical protein ABZ383_27505 [Streptomyces sp. NPDC005900]|uniref:hypothetical protein n=1 Tax=Streptomyces sp. NPDC005900 TaxID=3154569 RepID=UPI003403692A
MFRKHRYTILFAALIALLGVAVGTTWAQISGRRDMPAPVIIGLGLITALTYTGVDFLLEQRRRQRRRGGRPCRHRKAHVR